MTKKIRDIEYGMVIDHISLGKGTAVSDTIKNRLWKEQGIYSVTTGEGYNSPSTGGYKDIVKLEGKQLDEGHGILNEIAVLEPHATVNWIEEQDVIRKKRACDCVSEEINTDLIDCANMNCVTHEEAPGRFYMLRKNPLEVRCHYCEREFEPKRK